MTKLPQAICLSSPSAVQVEITSHCNLKCRMCPLTLSGTLTSLQPSHMEGAVWEKVRELGAKAGLVIFAGFGEPFTNSQFVELLQELDRLKVKTSFSTNGVAIKLPLVQKLNRLKHLVHINVSIDSPVPEIYQQIRGGSLHRALTGLETLMSKYRYPKRVTVSSVVMRDNIESLGEFPAILSRLGVTTYVLQGLNDLNPDLINAHIARNRQVGSYLDKIKVACAESGVTLNVPARLELEVNHPQEALKQYHGGRELPSSQTKPCPEGETKQCGVPWEIPFINKDGQVFPCCNSDETALMGDLREQSFEDIWNGDKFQTFRNNLLSGHSMPSICQRCGAAPIGAHPLNLFNAKIIDECSVFNGGTELRLVVENTGTSVWTKDTPLRIGTSNPKNRTSEFYHRSWICSNRICSFVEEEVPPGERATFDFKIKPRPVKQSETFKLVVDGVCWLPNTQFELNYEPSSNTLLDCIKQLFSR